MSLILRDVIIVAGECVVKVREVTGLNKDDTTPYLWCLAGRQPSRLRLNEVKKEKKRFLHLEKNVWASRSFIKGHLNIFTK